MFIQNHPSSHANIYHGNKICSKLHLPGKSSNQLTPLQNINLMYICMVVNKNGCCPSQQYIQYLTELFLVFTQSTAYSIGLSTHSLTSQVFIEIFLQLLRKVDCSQMIETCCVFVMFLKTIFLLGIAPFIRF